jgi:hypothetical protein
MANGAEVMPAEKNHAQSGQNDDDSEVPAQMSPLTVESGSKNERRQYGEQEIVGETDDRGESRERQEDAGRHESRNAGQIQQQDEAFSNRQFHRQIRNR